MSDDIDKFVSGVLNQAVKDINLEKKLLGSSEESPCTEVKDQITECLHTEEHIGIPAFLRDMVPKGRKAPRYLLVENNERHNAMSNNNANDQSLFTKTEIEVSKSQEIIKTNVNHEEMLTREISVSQKLEIAQTKENCTDCQDHEPWICSEEAINLSTEEDEISEEDYQANDSQDVQVLVSEKQLNALLQENSTLQQEMVDLEECCQEEMQRMGWQMIQPSTSRGQEAERAFQRGFRLATAETNQTSDLHSRILQQLNLITQQTEEVRELKNALAVQQEEANEANDAYLRDNSDLHHAFTELIRERHDKYPMDKSLSESAKKQLYRALYTRDKALTTCVELQGVINEQRLLIATQKRQFLDVLKLAQYTGSWPNINAGENGDANSARSTLSPHSQDQEVLNGRIGLDQSQTQVEERANELLKDQATCNELASKLDISPHKAFIKKLEIGPESLSPETITQ